MWSEDTDHWNSSSQLEAIHRSKWEKMTPATAKKNSLCIGQKGDVAMDLKSGTPSEMVGGHKPPQNNDVHQRGLQLKSTTMPAACSQQKRKPGDP